MDCSWMMGSSASLGNSTLARLTASRVSSSAWSRSKSASNSTMTVPAFSEAKLFTSSTPSTWRSSISRGIISNRSASSGEIPSCTVVITKKGTSICGSPSTGMASRAIAPASKTINRSSSVVRERDMMAARTFIENPCYSITADKELCLGS